VTSGGWRACLGVITPRTFRAVDARLVLDTNVYGYSPIAELERLALRGLSISVSEVAFTEAWAKSVREFHAGMPRERARGKLFGRTRSLAPYVDAQRPVALGAGGITHRIAAVTAGRPPIPEVGQREAMLNTMWRTVAGGDCDDALWIETGRIAEEWLTWRDKALDLVVKTVREQPIPQGWENVTEAEQLAIMRASTAAFCGFTPAMSERLDAHLCTIVYRMLQGRRGARMPQRDNDGADLHLTQHIADDCVLVTGDERLIDIVDRSRTYQAPWVRRLNDLENLPEGPPWGESARKHADSFVRKPR
jgi:hypothetical protein